MRKKKVDESAKALKMTQDEIKREGEEISNSEKPAVSAAAPTSKGVDVQVASQADVDFEVAEDEEDEAEVCRHVSDTRALKLLPRLSMVSATPIESSSESG